MAVIFGVVTLVTGPLWARRAWGTYWVWDARTTSSLVQWMVAWAYLILRRYGGPGSDKLAAGLALFGVANVGFIYISVNYWRTIHPATSVLARPIIETHIHLDKSRILGRCKAERGDLNGTDLAKQSSK
jgi:heme exporter protein C